VCINFAHIEIFPIVDLKLQKTTKKKVIIAQWGADKANMFTGMEQTTSAVKLPNLQDNPNALSSNFVINMFEGSDKYQSFKEQCPKTLKRLNEIAAKGKIEEYAAQVGAWWRPEFYAGPQRAGTHTHTHTHTN
jgi:hypothetical protein